MERRGVEGGRGLRWKEGEVERRGAEGERRVEMEGGRDGEERG